MTIASAAILIFLIMDPFGNMVLFNAFLGKLEQRRRIVVTLRESLIAYVILLFFLFTGSLLLDILGLREAALSISGSIILFLIALGMVFPRKSVIEAPPDQVDGEPLIVPLATPFLAGPSCIAVLLLLASKEPGKMNQWVIALTLAWLSATIILTASVPLFRFLGRRGSAAMERLMGMLLVMIAVQMFLDGIQSYISTGG